MNLRILYSLLLLHPWLTLAENSKTPAPSPATKPEEKSTAAQVTVDLEWIAMPHLEANRLLRETLKSAGDQKALRTAVEDLVTKKTARRADSATLTIPDGKKVRKETLSTKPFPVDWRFDAAADGSFAVKTTATTARNTGSTVEVDATVSNDNQHVLLNLSAERSGLLGELSWKAGNDNITQPVFTNMMSSVRSWVQSGEWYCQGVFRTWTAPPDGLKTAAEPPSAERVLLFARATVSTSRKATAAEPARAGCLVFCEWIDVDAETVSGFSRQTPKPDGDTIRQTLQGEISNGKAVLVDTAVLSVIDHESSRLQSLREHPWPVTFDLEAGRASARARQEAEKQAHAAGKQLPAAVAFGEGREAPISFQARSLGLSLEVEAVREEPGEWELNLGSEFSQLQPRESGAIAPPSSAAPVGVMASAPRVQQLSFTSSQLFHGGKTVMAGTKQNRSGPPRFDGGGDQRRPRRSTMMFVKLLE